MQASNHSSQIRAEQFGQHLLVINGTLLGAIALFAFLSDLAGAFINSGGFASVLYQNDAAIGMVEAHGLALIASALLVFNARAEGPMFNFAAATVHLLLGGANSAVLADLRDARPARDRHCLHRDAWTVRRSRVGRRSLAQA